MISKHKKKAPLLPETFLELLNLKSLNNILKKTSLLFFEIKVIVKETEVCIKYVHAMKKSMQI